MKTYHGAIADVRWRTAQAKSLTTESAGDHGGKPGGGLGSAHPNDSATISRQGRPAGNQSDHLGRSTILPKMTAGRARAFRASPALTKGYGRLCVGRQDKFY